MCTPRGEVWDRRREIDLLRIDVEKGGLGKKTEQGDSLTRGGRLGRAVCGDSRGLILSKGSLQMSQTRSAVHGLKKRKIWRLASAAEALRYPRRKVPKNGNRRTTR